MIFRDAPSRCQDTTTYGRYQSFSRADKQRRRHEGLDQRPGLPISQSSSSRTVQIAILHISFREARAAKAIDRRIWTLKPSPNLNSLQASVSTFVHDNLPCSAVVANSPFDSATFASPHTTLSLSHSLCQPSQSTISPNTETCYLSAAVVSQRLFLPSALWLYPHI